MNVPTPDLKNDAVYATFSIVNQYLVGRLRACGFFLVSTQEEVQGMYDPIDIKFIRNVKENNILVSFKSNYNDMYIDVDNILLPLETSDPTIPIILEVKVDSHTKQSRIFKINCF